MRVGDLAYALLSIIGSPMPQERGAEVEFNRFKQLQYAGSDAFCTYSFVIWENFPYKERKRVKERMGGISQISHRRSSSTRPCGLLLC
jgi:hypothetical protein